MQDSERWTGFMDESRIGRFVPGSSGTVKRTEVGTRSTWNEVGLDALLEGQKFQTEILDRIERIADIILAKHH